MENTEQKIAVAEQLSDIDLESLIKYGTKITTVEVTPSVKVRIKNLTQTDRESYSKLIKIPSLGKSEESTLYTLVESSRIPVLIYAIVGINDIDYTTPESKLQLAELLKSLPSPVIDKLYALYLEEESKLLTLLSPSSSDELKKK